jgi:carboxylesterase type B
MPRRNVTSRRQLVYSDVLATVNCSSLACLRAVQPDDLAKANNYHVSEVPTGSGGGSYGPSIGFSPFPDGVYIPDEPMVLLQQGRFHHSVKEVIAANMEDDGANMVMDSNMPEAFGVLVQAVFPTANNHTVDRIKSLFPWPPDLPQKLAWDWFTSVAFACHSQAIAGAYNEKARRYVMTIPPATHAEDLFCKFDFEFDFISSTI